MCYSTPIVKTDEQLFFKGIKAWFVEVVTGCEVKKCTHKCKAAEVKIEEKINAKILDSFFEATHYDCLWEGDYGKIVLYGLGDISNYPFPKNLYNPQFNSFEVTVTRNYTKSPARYIDVCDVYAKVFSVEDLKQVLKLRKKYKGIIVTAQKNVEWLEIAKNYTFRVKNEKYISESFKILSLDQSSEENKRNYISQKEVANKLLEMIPLDDCLIKYFTFQPVEKQRSCKPLITPVIHNIRQAQTEGYRTENKLDFDVRLCFSSGAPVYRVKFNNENDKKLAYVGLKKFLQQKPKCREWCNFGERWRVIDGYGEEPDFYKVIYELRKSPILALKDTAGKAAEEIKNDYTCKLCRRCFATIKKYEDFKDDVEKHDFGGQG